ncbi:sulfide/dihydroorotate dehydrogenase-like FAD/NAD-binding protein [bacterium]|nr:sulfide/dihydroorotate dehydrogenase-like FAD/NAD-binding protein [bacterium]
MFDIIEKKELAKDVKEYVVKAHKIANKAKPGQFVIVRMHEQGERIPLTIADFDTTSGTITLVVQEIGKSTIEMDKICNAGGYILDVVGPLGVPSHIEKYGRVICIGGGIGVAPVYPIARALKAAGNNIISIIGARSKELLIWEKRMRNVSDELLITTDDGTYGIHGFVTTELSRLLNEKLEINLVFAIGPVVMMRAVCGVTKPYNLKTFVSLNPVMVDGTGMCGACRVTVGNVTKFACVDGPDFDGHLVDFNELICRQNTYRDHEKIALERYKTQSR